MKKTFIILAAALTAIAVSCSETDLSPVEGRLDKVESDIAALQTRVSALEKLNQEIEDLQKLKKNTYVSGASKKDGVWTIVLSDGTVITVGEYVDGGNAPAIGIDSEGFWTFDGERLLHEGKPVKAIVTAPVIGVDNEGYWTVTIDGTTSRFTDAGGNPIKAVVKEGDSFFTSVEPSGDDLVFTLKSGEKFTLKVAPEFKFEVKGVSGTVEFEEEETKEFDVEAVNIADAMISAPANWKVSLTDAKLSITAPLNEPATKALNVSTDDLVVAIYAVSNEGCSVIVKIPVKLLEAKYDRNSYLSMWDAGMDINIGGEVYNKAAYGEAAHITAASADKRIYPGKNAVTFVDSDTEATLGWYDALDCIVIGDKPGTPAKVVASQQGNPKAGGSFVLKNVAFSWDPAFTNAVLYTSSEINSLVLDGCKIDHECRFIDRNGVGVKNVIVTDCDIKVIKRAGVAYDVHRAIITGRMPSAFDGQKIVFRNNVVWSAESTGIKYTLISSANSSNVGGSFSEVEISGNTFYKIHLGWDYFATVGKVTGSISVSSNLMYCDPSESNGIFIPVIVNGMTKAELEGLTCKTSGNSGYMLNGYWYIYGSDGGWKGAGLDAPERLRYPGDTGATTDINPFVSFDTATGKHVKASAFASVGASR